MWDNRENKKNPRAPDYKCRDKSCEGVIWPPKNGAQKSNAPAKPLARAGRWSWESLETQYGKCLDIAERQLKGLLTRHKGLVIDTTAVLSCAATLFIAIGRDGLQEAVSRPPAAALEEPPPQLATKGHADDDDLPF